MLKIDGKYMTTIFEEIQGYSHAYVLYCIIQCMLTVVLWFLLSYQQFWTKLHLTDD